ncbi:fructose-specific PTS transporter subunit EIIC [Streptomyces sp. NPDC088921]|uniref:fructose-specific PTS transporter subunit EIIC n=1 Tax=unclassified Streptomyces TaxID=2593676 RepID=UPI0034487F88
MTSAGNRRTTAPVTPTSIHLRPSIRPGTRADVRARSWLLFGTPYLGLLTVIGGLLVALAFIISGPDITSTGTAGLSNGDWTQADTWGGLLAKSGTSVLVILPPLIGAYIAYALAGLPAVTPGLIGGMAAIGVNVGYLGGPVAGVIAGATTLALRRIPLPSALQRPASTLLVPLVSTVCTAAAFFAFVGPQVGALAQWLHDEMGRLQFQNVVVLGLVLGLMACVDLNGILAGTAMSFGLAGLNGDNPANAAPLNLTIMAAVVAARMVPPLAMSLATLVRPRLFSAAERDCGKVVWLLGAVAVPEGALPFAFADPLRMIPACMTGGAVSAALVMATDATTYVPFGGVMAMNHFGRLPFFLLALLAGVLVTALLTVVLKSFGHAHATAKPVSGATVRTRARVKAPAAG